MNYYLFRKCVKLHCSSFDSNVNYLSSKDRLKLNFSDLLAISVLFVYLFRVPFYVRKRSREWKKFKKRC